MDVLTTAEQMRRRRAELGSDGVGLVPTMGYLHEGHLSLIRAARRHDTHVVVSVFVNPAQFGPAEDFDTYPRDVDRDLALLEAEAADVVFAPSVDEMYPPGFATYVNVEGALTERLCGASRPGHFRGVTTVVAKLFSIVQPTRAYFGQKDAQQLAVIRRMVTDLNLGVDAIACPTIRERDGLALSSRNAYLSPEARAQAVCLVRALDRAQSAIESGLRDVERLQDILREHFARYPLACVDYVDCVDSETLEPQTAVDGRTLLALAVTIGGTRLIDNRTFDVDACDIDTWGPKAGPE